MLSKELAKELVDLWVARYDDWVDGGREDKFLESLLGCGSCKYCMEFRKDNAPDDPFSNCTDDIFYRPCFKTYTAMRRKINGELTTQEADDIFTEELMQTRTIFEANYGS